MTIAPEIQSMIDWSTAVNSRYGNLPLPKLRDVLRQEHDEELRRRGVMVEAVAAVVDRRVSVAGGAIGVRIFRPHGTGARPAFVHLHGGGFVFGSIYTLFNDAKCAHICGKAGCVVVTVDYRLAPEFRFPTAPEDCYSALEWVVANAKELEIDPTRVAIGGESAGGNLAAVVALMARDRGGPALALQLLEVPVTDISDKSTAHSSVALFAEGYGLDRAEMELFSDAYLADPADGEHPYASPLRADDLAGVAPAHVLTAEYDILRDSGEKFARRLDSAGVETTLRRLPRHTHGSAALWQTWPPAGVWMDEAVGALVHAFTTREP